MNIQQLPNAITVLRFILILPIIYFLQLAQFELALACFLIAAISDGLDGFLARRFHWTSQFGLIADPLADKLLILVSITVLTAMGFFPNWFLVLVALREIGILGSALLISRKMGWKRFYPRWLSKVNTVLQLALVSGVLIKLGLFEALPQFILDALLYLLTLSTLISLFDYLISWRGALLQLVRTEV